MKTRTVTVTLTLTAYEGDPLPTDRQILAALDNSTAAEALATALNCDVSLDLAPAD